MKATEKDQLELPLRFRQEQSVGRAHLALEGTLVTYTIKRSRRRNAISILVDEDGVRVGAPWHATHGAIERLLHKHAGWVLRKLDEWQVRRAAARRWDDGEVVMLFGQPLKLKFEAAANTVELRDAELVVPAPKDARVARRVHEWLHTEALRCFTERVAHYRALLDVDHVPSVVLSSARTRWGSCHTNGRIHLNWRLVQMPMRLVDYVVAHEVAHLLEMNHSPRFWRAVARVMPDYAERRRELRRDGHRFLVL
jgi:predicted metal-dependent hydrolase